MSGRGTGTSGRREATQPQAGLPGRGDVGAGRRDPDRSGPATAAWLWCLPACGSGRSAGTGGAASAPHAPTCQQQPASSHAICLHTVEWAWPRPTHPGRCAARSLPTRQEWCPPPCPPPPSRRAPRAASGSRAGTRPCAGGHAAAGEGHKKRRLACWGLLLLPLRRLSMLLTNRCIALRVPSQRPAHPPTSLTDQSGCQCQLAGRWLAATHSPVPPQPQPRCGGGAAARNAAGCTQGAKQQLQAGWRGGCAALQAAWWRRCRQLRRR